MELNLVFRSGHSNLFIRVIDTAVYISLRFNYHFPGGPGLAGSILDFVGAKGDRGDDGNWSYK